MVVLESRLDHQTALHIAAGPVQERGDLSFLALLAWLLPLCFLYSLVLVLEEVDLFVGVEAVLFLAWLVEMRRKVLDGFAHTCRSTWDILEQLLLG